ncbi:uncharacterized protein E5676_scaffold600G001450 [Cucumis melo var. makuwa]|uniref:Uncharacterized protein n=1 Tax=Cucumis melo var. makuwa TaxID=1194695 RepID=A0A5D3DY86_CUCMM|nr:uncharacterized protein E5676_scaffold600G001450 [Cucumis melo var. makuwa]
MLRCCESHFRKAKEIHTPYKVDGSLLSLPIGFEMEPHTIKHRIRAKQQETLEKSLGKTQTKTEVAAAVDIAMEKLLQRIQTPSIYPMDQPSPPSAQPSGQKQPHAPPLSGAWAHAPLSINLTTHPICFYTSSPTQPSHPFGLPPPDSNLQNCQICTTMQFYPLILYSNLSSIGTELTNSITDWGLKRESHQHSPFMDSHIARSLTHYNEKNNGKPILVCEHCKKQWHTKDHCWELHSRLPRDNKRSSTSNRTQGAAMLRRLPAPLNQLALLLARPTPYSKRHCSDNALIELERGPLKEFIENPGKWQYFVIGAHFGGLENIAVETINFINVSEAKIQGWRFMSEQKVFWRKVVENIHGIHPFLWHTSGKENSCLRSSWISISREWRKIEALATFRIGNGSRVYFWTDPWLDNIPLNNKSPRLSHIALLPKGSISKHWDSQTSSWAVYLRRLMKEEGLLTFNH